MNDTLKGILGFKGERGYSAYEIAVQNGYTGSEQDWLATLGTSSHLTQDTALYTTTQANETTFDLPTNYTSNSYVEVYVNGLRLNTDEYTVNSNTNKVTLTSPLEVVGTKVEVVVSTMTTTDLPITNTITSSSTNDTAAGTKSVYDFVNAEAQTINNNIVTTNNNVTNLQNNKVNKSDITVITGSTTAIDAGATKIVDIDYPSGFTKANTIIIGKMVSSNNNYYDTADLESTANGFPVLDTVALTDDNIRIWLKNTNATTAKLGYYKITLMKVG